MPVKSNRRRDTEYAGFGRGLAAVVRAEPPRPNVMSFGEQVVEALGEFVDAKLDYARARRAVGGEFANGDDVDKTATRLQELLDKVRFAL